jgi:hypothetical protein
LTVAPRGRIATAAVIFACFLLVYVRSLAFVYIEGCVGCSHHLRHRLGGAVVVDLDKLRGPADKIAVGATGRLP